jgi:hypothetical protein
MTSQYTNERATAIQMMIECIDAGNKAAAKLVGMIRGLSAEEVNELTTNGAVRAMIRYEETMRARAAQWKTEVDWLTAAVDAERREYQLVKTAMCHKMGGEFIFVNAA